MSPDDTQPSASQPPGSTTDPAPAPDVTYGQVAYEAYRRARRRARGVDLPPWGPALWEADRQAWEAAASAVLEASGRGNA